MSDGVSRTFDGDFCVKTWTASLLGLRIAEQRAPCPDHLTADGSSPLPSVSLPRKAAAWAQLFSRFSTQARLRAPETESSYPL